MGLTQKEIPEDEWLDEFEDEGKRTMSPDDIDGIAGGSYWRNIVSNDRAFVEMEQACVQEYMKQMAHFFRGVCCYPIKEKYTHKIPKYRLIFGSRHPDAMVLINDAVCNARDLFLKKERVDDLLFDLRQDNEKHDPTRLRQAILTVLNSAAKLRRRELIVRSMEIVFGEYKESEHKTAITAMLKEGVLLSASGKTRINDNEWLSPQPFAGGKAT